MASTKSFRLVAAAAFASASILVALACGQSSQPDVHDNIIDDTHPTAMPTQTSPPPPSDAGDYDVIVYDSGYLKTAPDGYAPVQGCDTCACSGSGDDGGPGTYCFGGGGSQTVFPATCGDVDAAGSIQIGCNAIPAACAGLASKDTCPCILQQLGMFPCYLVCAVSKTGYTVYCPVP
jgi:hypothetical protein